MINNALCCFLEDKDVEINIQECFDEIFSGVCNPVISGIFLSLLKTKEENIDDYIGAINSARNVTKRITLDADYDFLIENICLNQKSQYLDVSFAMDIICCANDIGIVKMSPSVFCKNNSFNTLEAFNINTESLNRENYEDNKFIYSYLSSDNPYLKYTSELFRILPYKTILNIVNAFLNPYGVKNCTIALSDKKDVEKYAQICLGLGYINSVVFSSGDFPYVSIESETNISEAWKNKIFSYTVSPELLGIKQNSIDNLKIENATQGKEIIEAVFENKLKDSNYDAIVVNAGLALYITKKAKSLMEGIELARKTINEGKALEFLSKIKNINPSL